MAIAKTIIAKDKLVEDLLDRYEKAKAIRTTCNSTLEEVGKYVWPKMQTMVRTVNTTEGEALTVDIYDSTAIDASRRMTAGIFSYLMPVGAIWHEFRARPYHLNKDYEIVKWLSFAKETTHREIWRSNFQREMFVAIRSLVVFGTAIMSIEVIDDDLVFRTYHLGDILFEENSKGVVDVVFRKITYTARQARQEFGNKAGDNVARALEAGDLNQKFEFIHCVIPNNDYSKKWSVFKSRKKYKEVYINFG